MVVPLRRNREYAALWIGQATSNLGISISSFAYPLVVLAATGSAMKAGLVGTVLAGTAFVLRVPAGLQVDRRNRRAQPSNSRASERRSAPCSQAS